MSEIRFLTNLRGETATRDFTRRVRPHGWLLPPAYASAGTISYAQDQVRRGVSVLADNGLFDDLSRIARVLEPAAVEVGTALDDLASQLGRSAIAGEVPIDLKRAARAVKSAADIHTRPIFRAHRERSTSLAALNLSAFVGAEDPGPAVWSRLGVAPAAIGLRARDWRAIGRRVARAAIADRAELPSEIGYLPVASPIDGRSGRYIADEFAGHDQFEVAIAFGALVANRSYVDRVVTDDRVVELPENLPSSYVGSVVVLRSFMDSYRTRAGRPPTRLHLLGLGSPIMIGLAALICRDVPSITIDSTSPIRDAAFGTLYSNRPTLLKLNPTKVAMLALRDRRRTGWSCRCGSCVAFHGRFPQDSASARRAWQNLGFPTDLTPHLIEGEPVGDTLPLLARSLPGGERGPAARAARLGHNHWSLTRLCDDLSRHLRDTSIVTHMEAVVDRYTKSASLPYAKAVEWALDYASPN